MKRKELGVLLAGVLALGLGACSSTGTSSDTMGSTGETSTSSTTGSGSMGTGSTSGQGATSASGGYAGGSAGTSGSTGNETTGSTGTAAGSSSTGQSGAGTGSMPSASTSAPNSTVTNIEIIPRQSGGAGNVGDAAVGGSNTAGTTGSSMASDRVYRITLRMDNGTVQVITQEAAPSFSTGDRVRMSAGAIER